MIIIMRTINLYIFFDDAKDEQDNDFAALKSVLLDSAGSGSLGALTEEEIVMVNIALKKFGGTQKGKIPVRLLRK